MIESDCEFGDSIYNTPPTNLLLLMRFINGERNKGGCTFRAIWEATKPLANTTFIQNQNERKIYLFFSRSYDLNKINKKLIERNSPDKDKTNRRCFFKTWSKFFPGH